MRQFPYWQHRSTIAFVLLMVSLSARLLAAGAPPSVLLFTKTQGFNHSSISDGIDMFTDFSQDTGFLLTVTDQTDLFTASGLDEFDVVVWLSTTGDVLNSDEQTAFEGFMQGGGGYIGIHAAADCEYDWPWYGDLLGNGAWFNSHPSIQEALLLSEIQVGGWEEEALFTDEWYNFRENPREVVRVLQTLDENSYDPGSGAMGDDHPIAWAQLYDGGRVFYTGLGHRSETYDDPRFRDQVLAALRWTAIGGQRYSDELDASYATE